MSVSTTSSTTREEISKVYFIEAVGQDLIKIGYALDLQKRFTNLMGGDAF